MKTQGLSHFPLAASSLALALIAFPTMVVGCTAPPEPEPEIETVELGPGATANIQPDGDVTEAVGAGSFAGQLPGDFPSDLPVPPSSSVLSKASGRVVFGTEDSAASAKAELTPELGRAGWRSGGGERYQKGNRSISIGFAEADGRTTVTYRY